MDNLLFFGSNKNMKNLSHPPTKRSDYSDSIIKTSFCGFWCITLLLILACSIFCIIEGSLDSRSLRLDSYQSGIDEWESQSRADFDELSIFPYVGRWAENSTDNTALLKQLQDPDALDSDAHGATPRYEPAFYEELFPNVQKFGMNTTLIFDESLSLNLKFVVRHELTETHMSVAPVPLFKVYKTIGKFPSACEKSQGYFQYRRLECLTFWVIFTQKLVGMCLIVNPDGANWEVENNYGCCGSENAVGMYSKIDVSESQPQSAVPFENFKIRVRSGKDPIILARTLTEGNLNFGLPSEDWSAMGIVLLIISVYALIQPSVYLYRKFTGTYDEFKRLKIFGSNRGVNHSITIQWFNLY